MEFMLDGYCGLYCGACQKMLDTRAGTSDEPCYGCKSEQPAGHCATCEIRVCARGKGYAFCYECADLNRCELMHTFMVDTRYPYHLAVLKNLETIQRIGVDQWLQEQDRRWRCAACDTSFSWWAELCPQCGSAVANYKADL